MKGIAKTEMSSKEETEMRELVSAVLKTWTTTHLKLNKVLSTKSQDPINQSQNPLKEKRPLNDQSKLWLHQLDKIRIKLRQTTTDRVPIKGKTMQVDLK